MGHMHCSSHCVIARDAVRAAVTLGAVRQRAVAGGGVTDSRGVFLGRMRRGRCDVYAPPWGTLSHWPVIALAGPQFPAHVHAHRHGVHGTGGVGCDSRCSDAFLAAAALTFRNAQWPPPLRGGKSGAAAALMLRLD